MPEYRRNRIPGGCYFFTVNLLDRDSDALVAHINLLRDAVRKVRSRRPFHIDAWVVLPDHMHAVWTLPPGDSDYSGRWRAIKIALTVLGQVLKYDILSSRSFGVAPMRLGSTSGEQDETCV